MDLESIGIKERMRMVLEDKNTNPTKLSKAFRVNQKTLNSQINGETSVSANTIRLLLSAFDDISAEWLITGYGEMYKTDFLENMDDPMDVELGKAEDRIEELKNELSVVKSHSSGVPYYNVDFAMGFDLLVNDQTTNPDYLIDCPPYNKCDLWCNAHGDSMSPTIASGDVVALKRIEDFSYLVNGEIYALVTSNGLRTIKRVNDNGDTLTLIPDNKEFETQTLPKNYFTHVFLVKGAMKIF